jgi:hypothetical protein
MARGEVVCVIAQTEPGGGSDVAGIQTTARPTSDGWVLNGTKRFITAAMVCDLAIVVATTDRTLGREGIAMFLVEPGTPGFRRGGKDHVMGLRGVGTGELVFEDCAVPSTALLGSERGGFKRAMESLNAGRIGIAAQAVGVAQAALDAALSYAKTRVAFGKPIAELQAIQFMLADMATRLEAARLLMYRAAYLKGSGAPCQSEASMAKLTASEAAMWVTVLTESRQLWAIARPDRPQASRSRITSRSLRMGTLSAAISHLLGGDSAVRPQRRQRSGVFPGPATGARSGCSSGPESVFGLRRNRCSACAGMGVRLAPESVFDMARCTHLAEATRRAMANPGTITLPRALVPS